MIAVERDVVQAAAHLHADHAYAAAFPATPFGNAIGTAAQVIAVDFRDLYATVLDGWWRVDASRALNGRFARLDVLKA